MAKLWRSIVCQRVITDSQLNTATYVDGVEGFGVPQLPFVFLPVMVATVWRRDQVEDKIVARLRVRGPSGADVFVNNLPDVPMASDVHRYNVQIGGFNIVEAGDYEIIVDQRMGEEWKPVSVLPVYVQVAAIPVVMAIPAPALAPQAPVNQ